MLLEGMNGIEMNDKLDKLLEASNSENGIIAASMKLVGGHPSLRFPTKRYCLSASPGGIERCCLQKIFIGKRI